MKKQKKKTKSEIERKKMNMWCISYRDPGRDEVALV